ncbi:MAG: PH domain-containing protein [Flavobacteriaceae bacterium]|nr:PH domain-containing protein [Flavobacteriaceae bacterium]
MENKLIFKPAKLDVLAIGITTIIVIIFFGFLISAFLFENYFWPGMLGAFIILAVLITSYIYKPISFELNHDDLTIYRPLGIRSKRYGVREPKRTLASGTRTFGIGGVFGYFGWFNGNEEWFVTNLKKGVKMKSGNKTLIISPEDPDSFVEQLSKVS